MRGTSIWTDAQLREAFEQFTTPPAICRALGITNTAEARRMIRKRLGELGLIESLELEKDTQAPLQPDEDQTG